MKEVNDHNRDELIEAYSIAIVDGITLDGLIEMAVDNLKESLSKFSNERLQNEIKNGYEQLLED